MNHTPTIPTVFENDALIVADKPDGLSVIPERGDKSADLLSLLSKQTRAKLSAITLLDKNATGLILYAKTVEAGKFLARQSEDGSMQKIFIALLHGVTKDQRATVGAPLRKFGSGRMGVANTEGGMDASTEYRVMERFAHHTLVRLYPKTNRRHQMRVHMFSIGHPIVGDPLYGDPALQKPYAHMLLHCHELEFEIAPGEKKNITTPMPSYFGEIKKDLQRG